MSDQDQATIFILSDGTGETASTMIRAGFPPEADIKKLPVTARLQIHAAMHEAKLQMTKDPACAEYLCMSARKPL